MPLLPIPDRLVVLTFDDGNKSDITHVAPRLKQYGFSATFFITEAFGFNTDLQHRLTWDDVAQLHADGFEIGSHTADHPSVLRLSAEQLHQQLQAIELSCDKHRIPRPISFAYPGGHHDRKSMQVLTERGYKLARRGANPEYPLINNCGPGPHYQPNVDHPLLVPATYMSGPICGFDHLVWAIDRATPGRIAVLDFHGVPDTHPHCSTDPAHFDRDMKYLHDRNCTVIAMRDLQRYVDLPAAADQHPADNPYASIAHRFAVTPVDLKCEYAASPLGVDTPNPRFNWTLQSTRRDQTQAAYQILVASSEQNLDKDIGDLWDTGKVTSDQSINIPYQGRSLASRQRGYWKVRCWNQSGFEEAIGAECNEDPLLVETLQHQRPSTYSTPAAFEMGLLHEDDWRAQWIAAPDPATSSPLLRKTINIEKPISRATAYVSGLGYYELSINGRPVTDHVLNPASTYYHNDQPLDLRSRVLYATHDVTTHLNQGANALGVILGHGWYSAEPDIPPSPSHRTPYGDRPILLLQLHLDFDDGSTQIITTDDSWKTTPGPIQYNDYSNGETYDARREIPNWDTPDFDDAHWFTPILADPPNGQRKAQSLPPAKVVETIEPRRILNPADGVYIYDFGQNFSGWTRLRVNGPPGATITLRHAPNIHDDNTLDVRANYHRPPENHADYVRGVGDGGRTHHGARQTDTYILRGNGDEVWEPRFTLHGFRYAEVTGFPGTPDFDNLEARVVRNAVEQTGRFTCSNPLINRIHENVRWTFISSLQGIPQDAAERSERVAWLGDPIAEDYIHNFDTAAFWAKWLDDIADSQKPDGQLPVVSPLHWRTTHDVYGPEPVPVWQSTYPLVAWALYWLYDDTRILEQHYHGIKKLVEYLRRHAVNHIINEGYGDHMEPQPDGTTGSSPNHTPVPLTSTAYYFRDAQILSCAAQRLGHTDDARHYAQLAQTISHAFNTEFFDPATNQYGSASQTSNATPLMFGMVPDQHQPAVLKNLIDDVRINHDGHLTTGLVGTNALSEALPAHGAADVMVQIATQTTFPSWGDQIARGATTLWETWEGHPEFSFNMKIFGCCDKFFYKYLAGIQPAAPGYKRIHVKPHVVGDLTSASASLLTVRGPAAVDWHNHDHAFEMNVTIPTNTTAHISVPKLDRANFTITESGETLWQNSAFVRGVPGITGARETEDDVTFNAGSGAYFFRLIE
ncbi:MAG: hypothetical protein CMJ49_06480 [Planctomycetaceae bacterium]|nr:hypothetical protein [Planctomycetaceae bacterium]